MFRTERNKALCIEGLSVFSSVGSTTACWERALRRQSSTAQIASGSNAPCFRLAPKAESLVQAVRDERRYAELDRTSHMAIASARETLRQSEANDIGLITIGSSRGATGALEEYHAQSLDPNKRLSALASPITTSGALSSWVAQDMVAATSRVTPEMTALALTTSMTCTSGLHSLLTSVAFVTSGMARNALFGASEAPLTAFTFDQIEALRIGAPGDSQWPCRPCSTDNSSRGMVLGEAAGTAILSLKELKFASASDLLLLSAGWGIEQVQSPTGISKGGLGFERSMTEALNNLPDERGVDLVIMHAPGTPMGDAAELEAIHRVFGEIPLRTTKHVTGHTYGSSGIVSLQLAEYLLHGASWPGIPYEGHSDMNLGCERASRVLINTAGFGGNALSIVVGRP